MSQKPTHDPTLLERMSEEVAPEVSPFMQALIHHSRTIALVVVLCIVGALGYGGYTWYAEKQTEKGREALGAILATPPSAERLQKLEALLATAPETLKVPVALAAIQTGLALKEYQKITPYWDLVAKDPNGSLHTTALIGKAQALALADKTAEALAILEPLSLDAKSVYAPVVNGMIADLAEKSGNFARAISACEALAGGPNPDNAVYWQQKAAALRLQQSTAPKSS